MLGRKGKGPDGEAADVVLSGSKGISRRHAVVAVGEVDAHGQGLAHAPKRVERARARLQRVAKEPPREQHVDERGGEKAAVEQE